MLVPSRTVLFPFPQGSCLYICFYSYSFSLFPSRVLVRDRIYLFSACQLHVVVALVINAHFIIICSYGCFFKCTSSIKTHVSLVQHPQLYVLVVANRSENISLFCLYYVVKAVYVRYTVSLANCQYPILAVKPHFPLLRRHFTKDYATPSTCF